MTEHNATSLSASLVNRKVYTVCYTGLDTLSSFHDALYEARRSYFGSGKTVHIRARGIFDGLSGEVFGLPDTWKSDILASVIGSSHFISAGTVVRVRRA